MPVNNLFVNHAAIHMYWYNISVYRRSVFIYNNVLVYKSDVSVHAIKCVKGKVFIGIMQRYTCHVVYWDSYKD